MRGITFPKRGLALMLVLLALTSFMALHPQAALAHGASNTQDTTTSKGSHGVVTPNVSCSGSGCTGKDPYSTGCSSSDYTVNGYPVRVYGDEQKTSSPPNSYAYAEMWTSVQVFLGYVYNYYSSACGTNWSEVYVTNPIFYNKLTAAIEGQSSRNYWYAYCYYGTNCPVAADGTVRIHSPMYYAPNEATAAYGGYHSSTNDFANCQMQQNNGPCDPLTQGL